jgi:hypothetical protein
MHSVTNNLNILNVVILSVVVLYVCMLNAVMPSVVVPNLADFKNALPNSRSKTQTCKCLLRLDGISRNIYCFKITKKNNLKKSFANKEHGYNFKINFREPPTPILE